MISFAGRINRISLQDKSVTVVPFKARVKQYLLPRLYTTQRLDDEYVQAAVITWPSQSDDNKWLLFETLGKIWRQQLPDGKPQRLTQQRDHREYTPALSPDGQWVAYVSWDDEEGGHVWKAPIKGGRPRQLTGIARQYAHPAWSPDGETLVITWQRPELSYREPFFPEGTLFNAHHELGYLPASGGKVTSITTVQVRQFYPVSLFTKPVVSADGQRVFFRDFVGRQIQLVSIRFDGSERRTHISFSDAGTVVPNREASRVAFTSGDQLYVVPLTKSDAPVDMDLRKPLVSLRKVSKYGGDYPAWTNAGTLVFANGRSVFQLTAEAESPLERVVDVKAPRYRPDGVIVLQGARLITMRGDEVIPRGDIVVTGNRITAIGVSGKVPLPGNAAEYDLTGKTILPGLVDVHYHGQMNANEIIPETKWQFAADLAFGVTTGRDPAGPTKDMFRHADLIEAGEMIGPRMFNTGLPSYGFQSDIANIDDARRLVRNRKLHGARFIKQHSQPRRDVRQWLQQAAQEENLMIIAEGNSVKQHVNLMLDGYTSIEHANHANPIYKDIMELYIQSGVFYTPTLLVGYAFPRGLDYFYQNWDWYKDEKIQRFMQPDMLARYARHRIMIDNDEYYFDDVAAAVKDILRAGGKVAMGAHGNHPGLGSHWELWSFVMGGMTPHEALRAGTLTGIEMLGLTQDLGTLEVGKIADLIVLDENPLNDIHNTLKIHQVMKNGELFDADTLDKIWPEKQALGKLF